MFRMQIMLHFIDPRALFCLQSGMTKDVNLHLLVSKVYVAVYMRTRTPTRCDIPTQLYSYDTAKTLAKTPVGCLHSYSNGDYNRVRT